jgi:hypothetical protein
MCSCLIEIIRRYGLTLTSCLACLSLLHDCIILVSKYAEPPTGGPGGSTSIVLWLCQVSVVALPSNFVFLFFGERVLDPNNKQT